jgi:hypothetical protein
MILTIGRKKRSSHYRIRTSPSRSNTSEGLALGFITEIGPCTNDMLHEGYQGERMTLSSNWIKEDVFSDNTVDIFLQSPPTCRVSDIRVVNSTQSSQSSRGRRDGSLWNDSKELTQGWFLYCLFQGSCSVATHHPHQIYHDMWRLHLNEQQQTGTLLLIILNCITRITTAILIIHYLPCPRTDTSIVQN